MKSTYSSFERQVESLAAVFENIGNCFKEASNDLLVFDTRDIADVKVSKKVREVERVGTHAFVKERLVGRTKPITDVHMIKQNTGANLEKPSEISVFQRETELGVTETELLTLLAALYFLPSATGDPSRFFRS